MALVAMAAGLAACGDSEGDVPYVVPETGTILYDGTFSTTAWGVPYATDATTVQFVWTGEGRARVVVARMTARPATEETPARVMTDFTVEEVRVERQADGSYTLITADPLQGGGTMNGRYSAFHTGRLWGTINGREISFSVNYKFSPSPEEPLLISEFKGQVAGS